MTAQSATVVVRQYQNAIFSPLMRTHGWTRAGPPKFPFLWGGAAHQDAFRAALELRYHFLPHLYSLAHKAHHEGVLIARPAFFEPAFGDDADRLAWTYLLGDSILPAEVITWAGSTPAPPDGFNDAFENCVSNPEPCNEQSRNTSRVGNLDENTTSVELPYGT